MIITRKEAVCMYFSQECTDENYEKFSKKIEDFGVDVGGMDICYLEDPRKPVVVSLVRILADPYQYKRYITNSLVSSTIESVKEKPELTTELQVVKFINYVYLPDVQLNELAYKEMNINMKDIFNTVNMYTDIMINRSVQSFSTWCQKKGILLFNAPMNRKRQKTSSVRLRRVYVLKQEYLDNLAESIINYIPEFQKHINNLKEKGYSIVGYARKSEGKETDKTRYRLLERMVDCLKSRSLVNMVFVSPCCSSSSPLTSRDLKGKSIALEKIAGVHGNTQDLINYLDTTDDNVCLVIVDYSGLSTNVNDLKQFVSNHKKLKKIIIDQLPFKHETKVINREIILEDPSVLSIFNCRTNTNQRSKDI
ncbi:MAG: hypothetical protein EXX96DRAFT_532524 [Benjaminiella poitrasii]|nr:MAG: hypothetical protein EXX96DRAFT_532524 [Benjaminiella poitrasii]